MTNVALRVAAFHVQTEEATPNNQLPAEAMLQSLKRAQQPPQDPAVGVDSGRHGTEAASQLPVRPNVRKRFERVMASQISTLNRLITTAAKGPHNTTKK